MTMFIRRARVRAGCLVACLAAVLGAALATAPPAAAVAAFGPAYRATPAGCWGSQAAVDARGATHGFVDCYEADAVDYLRYVSAAPGATSWRLSRNLLQIRTLLGVADDGTATYALVVDGPGYVTVLKRTRQGTVTVRELMHTYQMTNQGAIAAANGRWWAVWVFGGDLQRLYQARTMGVDQRAHDTGMRGQMVQLQARSRTDVVMVRVRNSGTDHSIAVNYSYDGAWGGNHQVSLSRSNVWGPTLLRTGSVTRVAWIADGSGQGSQVVYADNHGGAWHRHRFDVSIGYVMYLGYNPIPQIAFSDGRLFLAWTHALDSLHAIAHVVEWYAGNWTHREVSDGTAGGVSVAALSAVDGKAHLVLDHVGPWPYSVIRSE